MELSIHFSGRLHKAAYLPVLIEEIKDVSNVHGWEIPYLLHIFQTTHLKIVLHIENIYGIRFTPTNCETISLAFLSNVTMVNETY